MKDYSAMLAKQKEFFLACIQRALAEESPADEPASDPEPLEAAQTE